MQRALAILFFALGIELAILLPARAQYFPMTNEIDGTLDSSSYGTMVLWQRYFTSYFDGMNPGFTNHIFDVSQSGSALEFDWEDNWPKWALPHMVHFPIPFYTFVLPNDNGGYGFTDVDQWLTNMLASPPLFWNGTASTNHSLSFQPQYFFPLSGIPGSSGDYTAPFAWQHASTNVSALAGTTPVPLVTLLLQSGGFTNFTYYSGSHPTPPQALEMAVYTLLGLNVETNVGTLTFDWGGAAAYTNHWAVSGVSVNGNILTATIHPTRMPIGFDVPDGYITNDCRPAFTNIATLGNAFRWILQVTNLPVGNYQVAYNGSNVVQLTDAQLAAGWNQWTNYNGVFWNALKGIQTNICVEYGVDPVSLADYHDAGSGGVHGVLDLVNWRSQGTAFYDAGNITGFLANMGNAVDGMDTNAAFTAIASQPPTATLTITKITPRFAPYLRADLPDERDLPTVGAPALPLDSRLSTLDSLKLAVRSVTLPPAPTGYLIPLSDAEFELPKPWRLLHLAWDASTDPAAAGYQVLSTRDLIHWNPVTNAVSITAASVPMRLSHEFFGVISVDRDGFNSLGSYSY